MTYSSRFIKDNIQVAVCREGLACTEEERAALLSRLSSALERGTKVYIGDHCSPVSHYIHQIFAELQDKYSLTEQLVMYSEHGEGYVIMWRNRPFPEAATLIEFQKKSELYSRADFVKEVSDYRMSKAFSKRWRKNM